jgi:hypothetical protein
MRTKHFDEVFSEWHSRKPTQSIRKKSAEEDGGKIPTQSMSHTNITSNAGAITRTDTCTIAGTTLPCGGL